MSGYPDDRDYDRNDRDRDDRDDRDDRRDDRRDDEEDVRIAKAAVSVPAVGLIVVGVLMLMAVVLNLVQFGGIDVAFDEQIKNIENNPQLKDDQKKEQARMMNQFRDWVKTGFYPYLGMLGLFAILVIVGGVKLMTLSSPGLVYLGAVLSFLPCTLCCVLGLIFGIWAIVVMGKPEVKAGYKAKRRLASSDSY